MHYLTSRGELHKNRKRVQALRMGQIVNGKWGQEPSEPVPATPFANWITKDGSSGFRAEAGRYHLYLNLGCPYSHRAHMAHAIKGLEGLVGLSITHPAPTDFGWSFAAGFPRATGDLLFPEHKHMWEVFVKSDPGVTARATVPVLFDTKTNRIVSAESADIVRQFGEVFDDLGAKEGEFYPVEHHTAIQQANTWLEDSILRPVFVTRRGPTLHERKEAQALLEQGLLALNQRLLQEEWVGPVFSEADIRAFVILVRIHVCKGSYLAPYRGIIRWLKSTLELPGVAGTLDIAHILATVGLEGPSDPAEYGLS